MRDPVQSSPTTVWLRACDSKAHSSPQLPTSLECPQTCPHPTTLLRVTPGPFFRQKAQHGSSCTEIGPPRSPQPPAGPRASPASRAVLTAAASGAPGGQARGPCSPSCRRALSWVKCPASFIRGLEPPHSGSTSSLMAMAPARRERGSAPNPPRLHLAPGRHGQRVSAGRSDRLTPTQLPPVSAASPAGPARERTDTPRLPAHRDSKAAVPSPSPVAPPGPRPPARSARRRARRGRGAPPPAPYLGPPGRAGLARRGGAGLKGTGAPAPSRGAVPRWPPR